MEAQKREYEGHHEPYPVSSYYDHGSQENMESQVMDTLCLIKQNEKPLLTTITCGDHQIMNSLVPEMKNTVIHLDAYHSLQKRIDPTLTRTRLQHQLLLVGKYQIMMKGGLVDVFGPVRVHINIDGADIYTSALMTEAEAHTGMIHIGYEDQVRKVSSMPLIKK